MISKGCNKERMNEWENWKRKVGTVKAQWVRYAKCCIHIAVCLSETPPLKPMHLTQLCARVRCKGAKSSILFLETVWIPQYVSFQYSFKYWNKFTLAIVTLLSRLTFHRHLCRQVLWVGLTERQFLLCVLWGTSLKLACSNNHRKKFLMHVQNHQNHSFN